MDSKKLSAIDNAKLCLNSHRGFVLQGGAGSGKTETLKNLLLYISKVNPHTNVACITHTNVAVAEIKDRVGDIYWISTIHAFLYDIIKDYKANVKTVISELFVVPEMIRETIKQDEDKKEYNKREHDKYKKVYQKYSAQLYKRKKSSSPKVTGKREYDQNPEEYNNTLNNQIRELNAEIISEINKWDCSKIKYNMTKFNSFKDGTYGHDGLLDIFHLLIKKFPMLKKIISDRYEYIFIDEYQDTRASVIQDLLSIVSKDTNFTVCLFGDSMQSIYNTGVGNVDEYINDGTLDKIPKPDNYRCAYEIKDLLNSLRLDGVQQRVALAVREDGSVELEEMRHGKVEILYSIYENKPTVRSNSEEKERYLEFLEDFIESVSKEREEAKILLLTNKAIAIKEGFPNLYRIFNERYNSEITERIDAYMDKLQLSTLCELCNYYETKQYNPIIHKIRQNGFELRFIEDKIKLKKSFDRLIHGDFSIDKALEYADKNNLLKKSESYIDFIEYSEKYLKDMIEDGEYQKFKELYKSGKNTYSRIKDDLTSVSEEEFSEYIRRYKKEYFIKQITQGNLALSEVLNYYRYVNETSSHITMHKTKGSSIDSVIVVMEEYFWTEYDFSSIYREGGKTNIRANSNKIIYVACSRARKNLSCIRVIEPAEEEAFRERFPEAKLIKRKYVDDTYQWSIDEGEI